MLCSCTVETLFNALLLKNRYSLVRSSILRRTFSIKRKNDSAVAEVIGTVLIFAIAVSLFTTFILWYVPSTGTANEQHYYEETQNAFYKFANELADSQSTQGQAIYYSFPMGINGVPPFSPSEPTSVSFSRNFDNFSASLGYSLTVTYTNSTGTLFYYNTSQHYLGKGVFKSNAETQFTTPTSYDLQDGFLIQDQGRSNPATAVGPLPVSLNSTGGRISMGSSLFNISGPSTTESSIGSTMVTLYYSSVNRTSYTTGELASINGTIGYIDSISMNSFNYNISSVFVNQWNYAFYQQFNNSGISYGKINTINSWNFSTLPFKVTVTGQKVSVSSSGRTILSSVDISAVDLSVNSL